MLDFTAGRYRCHALAMPSGSGYFGRVEYDLIVQGRVVRSDWMEFERRFQLADDACADARRAAVCIVH